MIKTKTIKLHISSYNANVLNGTKNSSIQVPIPHFPVNKDNIHNVSFSVLHAEIPVSFYIVNEYTNTLIVDGITYSLELGNYTITTLMTEILGLLPAGFGISYDTTTMKLTFTNTADFTISRTSTLNSILGGNTTQDMTSSANTLVMPFVVNLVNYPRLFLRCSQLNKTNFSNYDNTTDTLITIQNKQENGFLYYNNYSGSQISFSGVLEQMTQLNFRLTNIQNQEINLNGNHFSFTLQFNIEYLEEKGMKTLF